MGPPSYMRSVVDRNVVMRRMTLHPLYKYERRRGKKFKPTWRQATFCDVIPCGTPVGTDVSDKPEMSETASYTGTTAVHI